MKALLVAVLGVLSLSTGTPSMQGAGPHADGSTFSGNVGLLDSHGITVTEPTSHMTRHFVIVPNDGFNVISADGKTKYKTSAVHLGQTVKVEYDEDTRGRKQAVHLWLLANSSSAKYAAAAQH